MIDLRQTAEPVYYGADQTQQSQGNQLRDVEKRHGDLQQVEIDIVDLHEIHRDFAQIVNDHGQMIDNIESNVTTSVTYVVASNQSLAKAVDLQTAVRRKRILCGVITLILLVIIIIIIVVVVVKK